MPSDLGISFWESSLGIHQMQPKTYTKACCHSDIYKGKKVWRRDNPDVQPCGSG